jgi:hypothetical protein
MMKLIYKTIYEEPFDCEECGTCWPEHYTLSVAVGEAEEVLYEYSHDGHMGGEEIYYNENTSIVGAMEEALLSLHTDMDSKGDYNRKSIIQCANQAETFAGGLYSKWNKAKAFALALEDEGWEVEYEFD